MGVFVGTAVFYSLAVPVNAVITIAIVQAERN